jgi:ubiquinol-cytochrome c reductase cytochrome b subunit
MAITFVMVLFISGGNDLVAKAFDISLNAMTWWAASPCCSARQSPTWSPTGFAWACSGTTAKCSSTAIETGIIKRLPSGEFIEIHQPLGPVDSHGHGLLEYAGAPVPKRMNKLGSAGRAVKGFFRPVVEKAEIQEAIDAAEAEHPSAPRPPSVPASAPASTTDLADRGPILAPSAPNSEPGGLG